MTLDEVGAKMQRVRQINRLLTMPTSEPAFHERLRTEREVLARTLATVHPTRQQEAQAQFMPRTM